MSDLRALAERLEKATGADREIDALVCIALRDVPGEQHYKLAVARPPSVHSDWQIDLVFPPGGKVRSVTPPAYTSSLDAAIALCERVLEGCHWSVSNAAAKPRANVWIPEIIRPIMGPYSSAPTPALALCLAVVRAKMATTPKMGVSEEPEK